MRIHQKKNQHTSHNERQDILLWRKEVKGNNDERKIPGIKEKFNEKYRRTISKATCYRIFEVADMKETGEEKKSKKKKTTKSNEEDVDPSKIQDEIDELRKRKARAEEELAKEESVWMKNAKTLEETLKTIKVQCEATEKAVKVSRLDLAATTKQIIACKTTILQEQLKSSEVPAQTEKIKIKRRLQDEFYHRYKHKGIPRRLVIIDGLHLGEA